MRRLIPKKSKVGITVFRGLTAADLIVLSIALAIGMLILMSNFTDKWIMLAVFAVITVGLMFGTGEDRLYKQFWYLVHYLILRKSYVKGAKRGNAEDLIPFKEILPNGVIVYDSYFGAVVEIGSVSFGLLDEQEQDRRISAFASVLNSLGQTSVIQLVKIDRPINYDDVAERIFNKLEMAKEGTDKAKVEVLRARLEQVDRMNNVCPQFRPYYYIVLYEDTEAALLNQVDVCRNGLDRAGLDSSMLEAEDVAVFFKYCYTRNFDERKVDEIAREDYVDYVKPEKVKFNLGSYTCDEVYAFTMAVREYPLLIGNSWGADIFNIDNTKVVLTIKPVDKGKAIKRIDRAVVELSTRRRAKLSETQEQQTHIETMALLQQSIQNENEMLFDCTLTVTAFNNTDKPDKTFRKDVRRRLTTQGFGISWMLGRQYDGFAAATVAKKTRLRAYEHGINSESLAAVFPFVFSSVIEPDGFTLGFDYYPVILDIWKRDAGQYINSNLVVFGKTGSGKSYFTKLLLCNVYSENSRIFIIDPENEYQMLAKNVGGSFIDVGSAIHGRLNPLHIYPMLTDEGDLAAPNVTFESHLRFLDSFFRITLVGITTDALEELNNLVVAMYEKHKITGEVDCSEFSPEDFPTFDDLLATVENELKNESLSSKRKMELERVKTYMQKFATGGMYSSLWCGPSTLITNEKLTVFNFQSLFAARNQIVANAQILVVMRFLEYQIINIREQNRGTNDVLHPFIVVDEGYLLIDPKYPTALNFIYLQFKRIRKYEGSIAFITQNLSDVLGNQEIAAQTTAIINNAQYSFIFSLGPTDLEILINLYRNAGGINETECSQIANAGNGDCFAICSTRQRSSFHVVAHDNVRALFDPKFNQNIDETIEAEEEPDDLPKEY